LSARSVSSAKKRSTWLIHDADVGVKCTCQRALGEPVSNELGLVRAVVIHDDMDVETGGHVALDLVKEPAELGRRCRDMHLPTTVPFRKSYPDVLMMYST
jgi:hypothetical protein